MPSESGDMKVIGNFDKLIELVSTDTNYKPANALLKLPALAAQKAASQTAVNGVGANEASYKVAVNERQTEFEDLRSLIPRIGNMVQASGGDQKTRDNVKTLQRKLSGTRKAVKPKDDPKTPADEAAKTHSTSQQSYDSIVGNFDDLIAVVATIPSYAPNEDDLKITGLQARSADLHTKNAAVNTTFAAMSAARGKRDQQLYTNEDSIVNVALLVKAYVRAAFGADSQIYKQIKGLEFTRPKK